MRRQTVYSLFLLWEIKYAGHFTSWFMYSAIPSNPCCMKSVRVNYSLKLSNQEQMIQLVMFLWLVTRCRSSAAVLSWWMTPTTEEKRARSNCWLAPMPVERVSTSSRYGWFQFQFGLISIARTSLLWIAKQLFSSTLNRLLNNYYSLVWCAWIRVNICMNNDYVFDCDFCCWKFLYVHDL